MLSRAVRNQSGRLRVTERFRGAWRIRTAESFRLSFWEVPANRVVPRAGSRLWALDPDFVTRIDRAGEPVAASSSGLLSPHLEVK